MTYTSNTPARQPETLMDFADWLNNWGDKNLRSHSQWGAWRRQIWRDGYEQAMRDANKHFSRVFPEWYA